MPGRTDSSGLPPEAGDALIETIHVVAEHVHGIREALELRGADDTARLHGEILTEIRVGGFPASYGAPLLLDGQPAEYCSPSEPGGGYQRLTSPMDELEKTLRARLQQAPPEVPAELDAAILLQARRQLRLRRRRPLPWVAAAAAAALVLGLVWPRAEEPSAPRLDIVDAYVLAKRLERGSAIEPRWDLNGDGRVD